MSFLGNCNRLGIVEVFKKGVKEVLELINDITTNSTFEVRLLRREATIAPNSTALLALTM